MEFDVRRVLVEGGSELNAMLLGQDLVDEIFLTVAPKIKMGRQTPTIAGGEPFARAELTNWHLHAHHLVNDELFLRYRRAR
jgi:riboflavin biosynthesis pyrimidine reductase